MMMPPFMNLIPVVVFVLFLLGNMIKVLREYERGVIFRLGRLAGVRGPGIIILIPFVEKMVKVGLRTVAFDVPPQDIITRDNVSMKVNAVLYFRVVDPAKAIVEVEDFMYATSQLAQTTLRSVLGEAELDDLLANRDEINHKLQDILDKLTDSWGIKVSMVEVKHVDLPQEMQRAMARQAEAERERRAKIITAEGEFQAAEKIAAAAKIIGAEPTAIQLRFLGTLSEVAAENHSTIIFPLPIEMLKAFVHGSEKS